MTEQQGAPADSVPLTAAQKTRLLVEIIPLPFWLLVLGLLFVLLNTFTGRVPALLIPFVVVAALIVGYWSFLRARDLLSGVVLVRDDVLERTWRSGARGGGYFYARFSELGRLRLIRPAYGTAAGVERCRVYYSPASKIVWRLEPLPD